MADVSALSQYLASLASRRWQPGTLDCGVFMADWVRLVTGIDPIADVRGTYKSERQFLRIVRAEGGFESSCAARLLAVGYVATEDPAAGDLVTVRAPYGFRRGRVQRRTVGAICVADGRHAVMTSDLGLVIAGRHELPVCMGFTFNG